MTFKKNIGTDPRVFYVLPGGDDAQDGTSLETAKQTIQSAVDSVNALVPPVDPLNRAAIFIEGAGSYTENITFPTSTDFDSSGSNNIVFSGDLYTLGSFSTYNVGLSSLGSGPSNLTAFTIASQTSTALVCSDVFINSTTSNGVLVSGTTSDIFVRIAQMTLAGTGSIGINFTAGDTIPEVFLVSNTFLSADNTVGYVLNPSVSTARVVFDAGSISELGSPSNTTGIRVIDGHMSCFVNEIMASDAIDLQGGELSIISNCITGDITVAVGSTLICEIAEFSGTLTNNGTIQGRIGSQYFGSSLLSGPGPTVALNSAVAFDNTDGSSVTNLDDILLTRIGTATNVELVAGTSGTSQLEFTPSAGGAGAFINYSQSSGQSQFINTTGRMVLATSLATSDIVLEAGSTSSVILENPGANTNAPVQFNTAGLDGATVNFYVSDVNPNSAITANQGDICYVSTGVDNTSAVWIKEVGTGNTGWVNILSSSGGITGPGTSTLTGIPTWDVTDGTSLQDNPLLRYTSTASTSQFAVQAAATGTADIFIENSGGAAVGLIQNLGNDFRIAALASGSDLELSGLGGVTVSSFSGDVTIETAFVVSNTGNDLNVRLFPLNASSEAVLQLEDSTNTDRVILSFDDATDTSTLNLDTNIQLSVTPATTLITLESDNSGSVSSIDFIDSLTVSQFLIRSDQGNTLNSINSVNYDLTIASGDGLTLQTFSPEFTRVFSTNAGSTVQMLQLDNDGTNGAEVNIYTTTVSPEGAITANQGDFAFQATGADNTSAIWIKEVGTGNTGWQNILSSSGGISGPATSTVNSIPTFDVTTGNSVQDNQFLRYESDGATTSTLILQRAAAGSGEIELRNNADINVGLIQIVSNDFQIDSVNNGDLSLGSASDAFLTALSGGVTVTAGGDTLRVRTTGAHTAIFEASGSGDVDLSANAGSISAINNHGEFTMDNVAIAFVTALGVNFDVDASTTGSDINLTSDGPLTLQTQASASVVGIVGGGGDTFPIATFTTNGTGGGTFDLHVGDSTPQGRVSGANTLFFETGAASSGNARIHYQDTDATATNWNVLTSIGSGDTQAAGSFLNFPSTDLAQGTPTARMRYFETGVNTDIEFDVGANGVGAYRFKDELSNDRFVLSYNDSVPQATISTVASVPLNIFASGNLDMNATGTAELTGTTGVTIDTTAANGDINISAFDDCFIFANDELSLTCGGLATLSGTTRTDINTGAVGTSPFMNWSNNTANIDIFIYNNDPVAAVTGIGGDVLIRRDGTDSNVYIHKNNTSNNTDWRAMDAPAVLFWGDASIASTTTTRYFTPGYDSGTAPTSTIQYRLPRDGVLQNMYIYCQVAGGNGNNVVYTVRLNGINTALAVTLASNVQSGSNTTNRINAVQGDLIDIEITKAAGIVTSPVDVMASLELV